MEKVDPAELPNLRDLDFEQWADGSTWRAKRGVDFQGTTEGFHTTLRRWCKKNGRTVTTRRDTDAVTFRITRPG